MTLILARNPLTVSETLFVRSLLKNDASSFLVLIGPSPLWDTMEGERVYRIDGSRTAANHPALSWGELYDIVRNADRILTVS